MNCRLETAVSDGCCQGHIDVVGFDRFGKSSGACRCGDSERSQSVAQSRQKFGAADHGKARTVHACKGDEIVHAASGGKHGCFVQLGMPAYYIKRLASDRTGSAEYGYSFRCVHGL